MRDFRDMSKAWHDFLENGNGQSLVQGSQCKESTGWMDQRSFNHQTLG